MIRYNSEIILRCMIVGWKKKIQKKEIRGILYLLLCYGVSLSSFINIINKVRDKIIIHLLSKKLL